MKKAQKRRLYAIALKYLAKAHFFFKNLIFSFYMQKRKTRPKRPKSAYYVSITQNVNSYHF